MGLQVADPTFYLKMVPMLDGGDDVGMVLSPQCFYNVNRHGDIFNHQNIHFWEYMQPGYDALGFISCSGALGAWPRARPRDDLKCNEFRV
jgi:endoglucanase